MKGDIPDAYQEYVARRRALEETVDCPAASTRSERSSTWVKGVVLVYVVAAVAMVVAYGGAGAYAAVYIGAYVGFFVGIWALSRMTEEEKLEGKRKMERDRQLSDWHRELAERRRDIEHREMLAWKREQVRQRR